MFPDGPDRVVRIGGRGRGTPSGISGVVEEQVTVKEGRSRKKGTDPVILRSCPTDRGPRRPGDERDTVACGRRRGPTLGGEALGNVKCGPPDKVWVEVVSGRFCLKKLPFSSV